MEGYRRMLEARFDRLDDLLEELKGESDER
jgi:hypothetical protein